LTRSGATVISLAAALIACDAPPPPESRFCFAPLHAADRSDGASERTVHLLLDRLTFGRQDPLGLVAPGLDLDCHTTSGRSRRHCGGEDYVGPDGARGIDNLIAALLPTFEGILGAFIVETMADAVSRGEVLVVLEVALSADAAGAESIASARLVLAREDPGDPILRDGSGFVIPGEQLVREEDTSVDLMLAWIDDASLFAAHESFSLPLVLPNDRGGLTHDRALLSPVVVRVPHPIPPGGGDGILAGAMSIDELVRLSVLVERDHNEDTFRRIYGGSADLYPAPGGQCSSLSVGLVFRAIPVSVLDG
jgi:hypothetical protein